jgi:hypothetical protein
MAEEGKYIIDTGSCLFLSFDESACNADKNEFEIVHYKDPPSIRIHRSKKYTNMCCTNDFKHKFRNFPDVIGLIGMNVPFKDTRIPFSSRNLCYLNHIHSSFGWIRCFSIRKIPNQKTGVVCIGNDSCRDVEDEKLKSGPIVAIPNSSMAYPVVIDSSQNVALLFDTGSTETTFLLNMKPPLNTRMHPLLISFKHIQTLVVDYDQKIIKYKLSKPLSEIVNDVRR